MIFNVENLILESEEKLRGLVNGDFILQKLKQRCVIFVQADGERSTLRLILQTEISAILNQKLSNLLLELNLSFVYDSGKFSLLIMLLGLILSDIMK